ncbi:class I SAM-dependent methyltransferase [Dyella kyungheensis]|jgi:ubiquinone/menaquinone biosynthesis C-methylase UbiE|uniref:class I SAM-dependent methyltransferase n=1 Tax=Dyella kyungheensis TaxID=1242174 RepID=UPI003CECCB62
MKDKILLPEDVLRGYDAVCELYSHVPPLSHWRAWECAAYEGYRIDGRVLDLGCGDGRYFRLLWPEASDVVGVDMEPEVAQLGRQSGVYRSVHVAPAHDVPEPDASFDHVFANCSLEHMDHLDAVLNEIQRCLKPGGTLLCSVVTNHFIDWSILPQFVDMAGFKGAATTIREEFLDYHHLANPLTVDDWAKSFARAGLVAEEHVPILPKHNGGAFLLGDSLWHLRRAIGGEAGDIIYPFLSANPNFPGAFRKILDGLLAMETDWLDCCGAVFLVRKPR